MYHVDYITDHSRVHGRSLAISHWHQGVMPDRDGLSSPPNNQRFPTVWLTGIMKGWGYILYSRGLEIQRDLLELYCFPLYIVHDSWGHNRCIVSQQTQNICITFVQCWTNVEDVGLMLFKCYANVLCLLGYVLAWLYQHRDCPLQTTALVLKLYTLWE